MNDRGPAALSTFGVSIALALACLGLAFYLGAYQRDASRAHRASLLNASGRYEQALSIAQDVTHFPSSVTAITTRALALAALGRVADSERALRAAIRLDPHDSWLYSELALVYRGAGNMPSALRAMRHAIALNPKILVPGALGVFSIPPNKPATSVGAR